MLNLLKSSDNSKLKSNWGCCIDCITNPESELWEIYDGCIYLIIEIIIHTQNEISNNNNYNELITYVNKIWKLLIENDTIKLHETIYTQVSQFVCHSLFFHIYFIFMYFS